MNPLRILIVDDHEAVRLSLRSLLSARADWMVCGEAQDGTDAVEKARNLRPDIVLMDVSMPRMDGLEATTIIRKEIPECQVIVMSQNDPVVVLKQAMGVGARGCVAKVDLTEKLLPTIEKMMYGNRERPPAARLENPARDRNLPSPETFELEAKVRGRLGVLPNFFRLTPETPEITENLWGFAQAAYLDNPLPSLFKERLFVQLSRFCEVRYCIARHMGFLAGLGRPAGDARSPVQTVPEIIRLLRRPFPRGEPLVKILSLYGSGHARLEELPDGDSETEEALFAFATHVFLQTADAAVCLDALKSRLGEIRLQYLILFLAFIRTAHYWSKVHPDLVFEEDVKRLLAMHEELAEQILKEPEDTGEASQKVLDELPSLRAKAEQASNLLAAIVDSSDDAIVSKNLDGVITSWNKSAERLFGYTAKEAVGRHVTLIIPHDRMQEETVILDRLRRGERVDHFETIRMRKDGGMVNVSLTISPVKDAAGRVVGASKVARDITERNRRESERQKLMALADRCTEFIGMCDMEYRPFYVNDAGLRLLGLASLEELRSVQVGDFFFPEDSAFIASEFFPKVLREGRGEVEVRFRNFKTGAAIWMIYNVFVINDLDGKPIALGTFSQNITGRKQSEQALRESEERLRTLTDVLETQVRLRTQELEERNAEILQQSERLRELSNRLLQTGDEERRHIARELHDSTGQVVAALGLNLAAIARQEKQTPVVERAVQESQDLVEQLSKEVRTMSYLLHPPLLDESGLPGALRWYIKGLVERSGLAIRLNISEDFGRLPHEMELAVFRIVQECLTNIHRHSGSKTATIRISRDANCVLIEVQDQGKGISPEKLAKLRAQRSGVGITGMRERVRHFGGSLDIESSGDGAKISAMFPTPTIASSKPEGTLQQDDPAAQRRDRVTS